jgi:hypothetical protein
MHTCVTLRDIYANTVTGYRVGGRGSVQTYSGTHPVCTGGGLFFRQIVGADNVFSTSTDVKCVELYLRFPYVFTSRRLIKN